MIFDRQPNPSSLHKVDVVPDYSGSRLNNHDNDSSPNLNQQERYIKKGRPALIKELVRRGKTTEEIDNILKKSLDIEFAAQKIDHSAVERIIQNIEKSAPLSGPSLQSDWKVD